MPVVTMEDVVSGLTGFIVVRARRKAARPSTARMGPRAKQAAARVTRKDGSIGSGGVPRAASHMAAPTRAATMGGGTLSSRAGMVARKRRRIDAKANGWGRSFFVSLV